MSIAVTHDVRGQTNVRDVHLDQFGVALPVPLVGHSFGALVALDFALDHPDRVQTLVLAEPPAFWVISPEERQATADMRTMGALLGTLGPTAEPTDDQLLRFQCALGNCGTRAPMPTEPAWVDWISRRSALRGLSVVTSHTDQISRLRSFRRPVLVITGSNTVSFQFNDFHHRLLARSARARTAGTTARR